VIPDSRPARQAAGSSRAGQPDRRNGTLAPRPRSALRPGRGSAEIRLSPRLLFAADRSRRGRTRLPPTGRSISPAEPIRPWRRPSPHATVGSLSKVDVLSRGVHEQLAHGEAPRLTPRGRAALRRWRPSARVGEAYPGGRLEPWGCMNNSPFLEARGSAGALMADMHAFSTRRALPPAAPVRLITIVMRISSGPLEKPTSG
jgi:hypothetical protein